MSKPNLRDLEWDTMPDAWLDKLYKGLSVKERWKLIEHANNGGTVEEWVVMQRAIKEASDGETNSI